MVQIDAVIEDFLTDKGKGQGGESGNYCQDVGRELNRFVDFLKVDDVYDDADNMSLMNFNFSYSIETTTCGAYRPVLRYLGMKSVGWQETVNIDE